MFECCGQIFYSEENFCTHRLLVHHSIPYDGDQNTLERLSGFYSIRAGRNELFVQGIEDGPTLRISFDSRNGELTITSHSAHMSPWMINGLEAFKVRK